MVIAQVISNLSIGGAERLFGAVVGGWNAIVKKGEYKVTNLVVVATTDAVIPLKLSDGLGVTGYLRKGQRVRTVKLRGLPVCSISEWNKQTGKHLAGGFDV